MDDNTILLAYAKHELSKEQDQNSKHAYELKYYISCMDKNNYIGTVKHIK